MDRRIQLLAYALFVASGATGLVYEVTWFRNLSLIFGASFEATSIVLASFMGGMSVGGFVFGRLAQRFARPLRVYGLLEIGIGCFALLLPGILRGIDAIYVGLALGDGDVGPGLQAMRTLLAFGTLAVPTFLMGATLPVVMRLLVRRDADFGVRLSWLYGSNTLGAVLGTLLAGFVMIPALGVWQTQLFAVAVNLLIGTLALGFDRSLEPLEPDHDESLATAPTTDVPNDDRRVLVMVFWGTLVSGFASLALEVLWTRALSVAVGSSTYSFSVMLAAFLMGICLGSALHAILPLRRVSIGVQFGCVALLAGAFSLAVSIWIPRLPQLAIELNLALFEDLSRIRPMTTFLLAFALMLVPCLFIGIAFPLANQARARLAGGFAQPVGDTLSLNTLGSITGSLGAGFVLIPAIGLQRSMLLGGAIYLAYGAFVLGATAWGRLPSRRPAIAALTTLAVIGALALPPMAPSWSGSVLGTFSNNQLIQYVDAEGNVDVAFEIGKGTLRYYREGRGATVSVLEQDGYRSLSVNGKIVASDDPADLRTQYMLAHVPILMHPDPRSALVVGMGAGTTLGGVTAHESLDAIALAEIEPAILGAEPAFATANGSPLADPRLRVYLEDGRNYLKTTTRRFDVITADPIHPWNRGSGYLYTEEYYRLAAARLTEGGVMCQWLPVADLTPKDFKSVVATFARVFPHTMMWHSTAAILIGSERPLEISFEDLARRLDQPRVRGQLAPLGLDESLAFLGELQLVDDQVRAFAGDALINTDDNLYLEFSSPLAIGGDRLVWSVLDEIHAFEPGRSPLPEGDPRAATVAAYQNAKSRTTLAEIALRSPQPARIQAGIRSLRTILDELPDYRPAAIVLADYLAYRSSVWLDQGRLQAAARDVREAVRLEPENALAHRTRGVLLSRAGRNEQAIAALERSRALQPRQWLTHLELARALMADERRAEAIAVLEAGLEIQPDQPEISSLLREWRPTTSSELDDAATTRPARSETNS